MADLSQTIAPKSDQMNADDLIAGPRTITVSRVSATPGDEQPVSIGYGGDRGKPYKPCKSMRRVLVALWGPDGNQYVGRSMTLYRDAGVQFGGAQVGGIRISHMSHIDKPATMALTEKRASRKPFTVQPLAAASSKAEAVTDALVQRIRECGDLIMLQQLTAFEEVVKQRAWLEAKRPELAERVNAAVAEKLAVFEAADQASAVA